jgi:hypothetical protein
MWKRRRGETNRGREEVTKLWSEEEKEKRKRGIH